MSDWKAAEDAESHDFLYMEEVNSNDGASSRLTGINPSATVQDLKKAIAVELKNPAAWSSVSVVFANQELSDCKPIYQKYVIASFLTCLAVNATLSTFQIEEVREFPLER